MNTRAMLLRKFVACAPLLVVAAAQAEQPTVPRPYLITETGCKFVRPGFVSENVEVIWGGQCIDGYVTGQGEVTLRGSKKRIYTGTFASGEIQRGTLWDDWRSYKGAFKANTPQGQGTMTLPNGRTASGHFERGRPVG